VVLSVPSPYPYIYIYIVGALCNSLGWPLSRRHLIEAEDIEEEGYPYDMVSGSGAAK
jgi:hypothetical protein